MFNSALGLIPNMARAMAQSPAVLEGYVSLSGALSKGSLGRKLGEELALTLAGTNRCDYCASAHTALGKLAGLSEAQTVSALQGNAEQTKDAAALRFANAIVEKRGRIDDADFKAVTDAGFTAGEAGEIVAHVALNVFTNYFNNVAKTEIDFPHIDVTNIS
jgi:AhpD family alkylhydroperoxidase